MQAIADTTERRPFVEFDFRKDTSGANEPATVTVTKAELDGVSVTSSLSSSDNKRYFYLPTADLAIGDHEVIAIGEDTAGNKSIEITKTFEVSERTAFVMVLTAGWNAVSFPATPEASAIDDVFTNTGIDQVLAYDAINGRWQQASRPSGTDTFINPTPEVSMLSNIAQGVGYWVHTSDFEEQEVALKARPGPGADLPPDVATIPVASGWNFVGIIDISGDVTTGDSGTALPGGDDVGGYLNTVTYSRAYRYDPTTTQFVALAGTDAVLTGWGVWVFITPQADGSLPAIAP